MQLTASQPQYAFGPVMMAEGGLAAAARHVQNKGRGDDTVLVHMTPGEVKGLQALAMAQGGSLTINPDTGLPEAGFLKNLLPMIAGFALNAFLPGVGTAIGSALGGLSGTAGTSILVGGLTGLATGSLKQGLMAGLGAYGGAGLGEGLAGASAAASPEALASVESANQAAQAAQATQDALLSQGATETAAQNAYRQTFMDQVSPYATTGTGQVSSGLSALTSPEGRAGFMSNLPTGTLTAAGTSLASAMAPEPAGYKPSDTYQRPYEYSWNKDMSAFTPSPTPGDTSERRYFNPMFTPLPIQKMANGGLMGMSQGGYSFDRQDDEQGYAPGGKVKQRSLKGDPLYKFAQDRKDSSMEAAVEQNFAKGGLGALPPRFLSGGGDGMSDSIKANIDGVQEARLADGEFVVPADVVSHLGNGSSKAGAKKLYAMMDKIRKARTGSKRQAPEVNAARYMPA